MIILKLITLNVSNLDQKKKFKYKQFVVFFVFVVVGIICMYDFCSHFGLWTEF